MAWAGRRGLFETTGTISYAYIIENPGYCRREDPFCPFLRPGKQLSPWRRTDRRLSTSLGTLYLGISHTTWNSIGVTLRSRRGGMGKGWMASPNVEVGSLAGQLYPLLICTGSLPILAGGNCHSAPRSSLFQMRLLHYPMESASTRSSKTS